MIDDDTPLNREERISAWIDGMLDSEGSAAMKTQAMSDEAVAKRAQRLRQMDDLVRAAVPAEDAVPDALLSRLGLSNASAASNVVDLAARRDDRPHRSSPAFGRHWRMAAQVALVGAVGLALVTWQAPRGTSEDTGAAYRALSDASRRAPAEVNGLVVFAPGTDAQAARAVVESAGGRLVGQPNQAGAWKLAAPAAQRDSILATLRADARVAMAEPISSEKQ